jgi:hypothetical protein
MKLKEAVLALAGVIVVATMVSAEPSPEAAEWLDRLEHVYDKGPFSLRYETEVNVLRAGLQQSIKTQGRSFQAGRKRFRFEVSMETITSGADSSTTTKMIGTSDSEVFWLEVNNVTKGRRRVFRMPMDRLEAALQRNHPIAQNVSRMDPVSQIRKLATMFDFEVGGRSENSITLVAEVTDEVRGQAGKTIPGDPSKLEEVTITFDTRTQFPTEARFGEETPVMWIGITEFEYLDAIDEAVFRYEPPEGVDVVNLGDRLKGASEPRDGADPENGRPSD